TRRERTKSWTSWCTYDFAGNGNRQHGGNCLLAAPRLSYRSHFETLLSRPARRLRNAQDSPCHGEGGPAPWSNRLNDYLLSVLLGIVEGSTEFLPVSSTAHLRLSEALLHVDLGSGYWKMYSIVIQLGAILTLPIYFRERIAKFLSTFPRGERGDGA